MIAMDRGRKVALGLVAAATVGVLNVQFAQAQRPGKATATPPQPAQSTQIGDGPMLKEVRVPTNTTDPIAIVNGEVITRQQLADECVARKGQEILETLISRRLIEQAMRAKKLDVTAAEIDDEITSIAQRTAGISREDWLRTLDKERKISPAQYARDIIYPALALRKLAGERVQVTDQDVKDAFEANYGQRMRCRIIMCKDIRTANEIWEELRKNPGGFERIAKDKSLDPSTRASGGMLPDAIARHAYPRTVSDAAFAQLVDGDPKDTNPAHKPKDGDFTGPIQVSEDAWVIMRREEIIGGGRTANINDPAVRTNLKAQMYDVKLNDAMTQMFTDLLEASSVDNKLTGQVKIANEKQHPDFKGGLDAKIERMSAAGETQPTVPTGGRSPANVSTSPAAGARPPAGVPAGAAATTSKLQQTIQSGPKATPPGN